MAAAALSIEGWDVRFLGANTPTSMICRVAKRAGAVAVAGGSSSAASPSDTAGYLKQLDAGLDANVALWLGGAQSAPRGRTETFTSIGDLVHRARQVQNWKNTTS